jgi:hypothetical protein
MDSSNPRQTTNAECGASLAATATDNFILGISPVC